MAAARIDESGRLAWTPQAVISALSLAATVIIAVIGCSAWVVSSAAEVRTEVRAMRGELTEFKSRYEDKKLNDMRDIARIEERIRGLEQQKGR